MKSPRKLNRRNFIAHSSSLAAGAVALTTLKPAWSSLAADAPGAFRSQWQRNFDRVWLGPEYWANPLQDWRVANGRAECVNAAPGRNVHLLTHQLAVAPGNLRMSVRLGRGDGALKGKGSAGFSVGVSGPLKEYRNSVLYGRGLDAGVTGDGRLFLGDPAAAKPGTIDVSGKEIELRLTAEPVGTGYRVNLSAHDAVGKQLGQVTRDNVPAAQLAGNLALAANFGAPQGAGGGKGKAKAKAADGAANPGVGEFWFTDWRVEGTKLQAHADHAFGPILFTQYTLSGGVLKLTAQMPPIGTQESQTARLEVRKGKSWSKVAEEKIHPDARTVTFRAEKWDDKADHEYRVVYAQKFKDGQSEDAYWTGTIRRDPVDQPVLTVGDVSCNIHSAFPNHLLVANMAKLKPDFLAFTGDQFYESTAGYGVQRAPLDKAMIDYLRKWYVHGWTWRELMRDRPSISIPDDHDVYQGNLWGEAGDGRKTTQEAGGYDMPVEWVNVVHRTQTSHHPDPYDARPCKRGTTNYYGPLTYGRVSFAVIADRQYKSGPEGKVPPTGSPRGDHVKDPNFDPKTADLPGLELLGPGQMKFLNEWVADWRGADMKAVVSQTIFTAMATTHGGQEVLVADYDTNGWPQSRRNEALRVIRKAFAVHLAGDQHLPAVVHYGVDEHRDAGVAFAGPAVNVGYVRFWEPERTNRNRKTGNTKLTGDFHDHFGNPLTVLAVKNGAVKPDNSDVLKFVQEKASGLGVVRFDKPNRRVTIECWPYLADPTHPGTQFPGWPVVVNTLDNYARKPAAHLPTLKISGAKNPVVHIFDNKGELVYALRLASGSFQPHVFAAGRYTVRVSEPDTGKAKEIKSVEASAGNKAILEVRV
ncbi:MAG: alkaline phosphatase D family protein [Verrucomicrobiota bacterium]